MCAFFKKNYYFIFKLTQWLRAITASERENYRYKLSKVAEDIGLPFFNALKYVIFPLSTMWQMHLTIRKLKRIQTLCFILSLIEWEWKNVFIWKDHIYSYFQQLYMKVGNLTCQWFVVKSLPHFRISVLIYLKACTFVFADHFAFSKVSYISVTFRVNARKSEGTIPCSTAF